MTIICLGLLVTALVLTMTHHDATSLLAVLVAVLGSGIPGIAALSRASEFGQQVGQVGQQVSVVQHQTNGNMSRLLDLAERVVAAQIDSSHTAHATVQQVVTAMATAAESPAPVAEQVVPSPRDVQPPPSGGWADLSSGQ